MEVDELRRADPTPIGEAPADPEVSRAVGRASVVLLSSHFERYFYALNEEVTERINDAAIFGSSVPESLRLLHSQEAVDLLSATRWEKRAERLMEFVENEAWLWGVEASGNLEHRRFLAWMKAPTPLNLAKFFKYWGVPDIFSVITRAPHTRSDLWLRIEELVGKRNNIAHGDLTVEATQTDLSSYQHAASTFCERSDRVLDKKVDRLLDEKFGW